MSKDKRRSLLSEKGRHKAVYFSISHQWRPIYSVSFPLNSLSFVWAVLQILFNLKSLIMYLNRLQQDEVFVPALLRPLEELTGMPSRKGLEQAIVSHGKIVNIVSKRYGHIPNELFFGKAEERVIKTGLEYCRQTINRSDRSFSMDFILTDDSQFSVGHRSDAILPMLRFTNSYDGSERTSGHFGFYRKVCSNGLHMARTEIGFSIKHHKNSVHLIMPELEGLFRKFMDNEFYTISDRFHQMMSVELVDIKAFVREVLEQTKLFRYECSDRNDAPSKRAREVIEILDHEAILLGTSPNLWLGYNAFNAVLHRNLKKSFSNQQRLDKQLFETVFEMA